MTGLSCASSAGSSAGTSAASAVYGSLGAPTDAVPFMSAVRSGALPSGLKYFILENAKPEGRAYLTLAVNAGSVLETDEEQGLAHFVEHMAFDGTERFPKSELIEYLRSLGMRWGPEVNAYTSYDRTVYGIEVPVEFDPEGRKVIPGNALAVIDDWTHAITFTPEDVQSERPVILEEYRTRLGAWERIQRKMMPVIFRGSPYAERLPIGLPEVIETAPAERLAHFYQTWYRADNMALVFVGDFDGAALEAALGAHFSIPAPAEPLERPAYELPEPKKGAFTAEINTDPELPYTRIDLYYKLPSVQKMNDLAAYRQGIIDLLIDRMLSLRFEEAAYKPETPYTAAGAGISRFGRASRYYVMVVIAKPGSAEAALSALLREKETMARYGFTGAEIDQAKRSLLADLERMVSEKDRQHSSRSIDDLAAYFLTGQMTADIDWDYEAASQLLPGISAQDIAAAAKKYFAAEDLTVFVNAPEAETANLPSGDRIRRLVSQSRRARIAKPQSAVLDDQLLDQLPAPGRIIHEAEDPASGTLRWELSNGARLILKETKNKNNEIVLYALAKGGITAVPEAQILSADLAAEMLNASGIGPYSRPELVKKLADKQVSLSFSLSGFIRNFQGAATTRDLKTLFELLYLEFTQPRIDSDVVAAMIDEYRTQLAQHDENPEAVFFDEVTRTVFSNNPYYTPMTLADLDKIDTAPAMALIKRALNPADYTFVFTGNLDIPALRSFTETYLAAIPGIESWNTWADIPIVRPGKIEKAVYKGQAEKSLVFLGWIVPQEYSETGDAVAAVLSEYLDNKLLEKTRKQMGGTYSLSAGVSLSPLPPPGELSMNVYFPCDPARVGELSAAIQEELDLIAGGTIDQDAFTKSVSALQKTFEASMQDNTYIGRNYANFAVIFDRPLSQLEKRPGLYDAVSPQDLQRAMEKLLPRGPIRVILYPAE
jgi:zinc protease